MRIFIPQVKIPLNLPNKNTSHIPHEANLLENPEASFFGSSKNPSPQKKILSLCRVGKFPIHHLEGTDALVEVVVILVMVVVVSVVEVPVLKGRLG